MAEKEITNEELARMIARGFEETAKKTDVNKQFADVHAKLDHIENILLTDHKKRIEKLEQAVKELKEAVAM